MFQDTADIIRTSALILAVIIPAITLVFQYRREERNKAKPPDQPTLVAVGGALASREGAILYVEAIEKLTDAIEQATDVMRRGHVHDERLADAIDRLRRAVEDGSPRR